MYERETVCETVCVCVCVRDCVCDCVCVRDCLCVCRGSTHMLPLWGAFNSCGNVCVRAEG